MEDNAVEQALTKQLTKSPEESRKYQMTKFGVYTILGVFGVSTVLFLAMPSVAAQNVILAQIVVGSIAGLVGIFCGAQATVDFKNSASLAAVVESRQQDTTETRKQDITITERRVDPKDVEGAEEIE